MPRVALTLAQREAQKEADQRKRVTSIIKAGMGSEQLTRRAMAAEIGMKYSTFCENLNAGSFRSEHLSKICDKLYFDDLTRSALLGSSTKCRFDKGFR